MSKTLIGVAAVILGLCAPTNGEQGAALATRNFLKKLSKTLIGVAAVILGLYVPTNGEQGAALATHNFLKKVD